ncbi:MAG: glycosyltransferase [Bacteroides sp.]|nr:glycosyltransferase [Bacteroides sp.]
MRSEQKNIGVPVIAIIVPSYNDEKYIRGCLDSIKCQTAPFWEAWIVDDCSKDKSAEIAEEYQNNDNRFHLIRSNENLSAWTARAKGILAVSPSVEYIMFADADDTLRPDAVERLFAIIKKTPVDIVHFGTNVVNCGDISKERIIRYDRYLQPQITVLKGADILKSFVESDFEGHLWNKMFKASLLKKVIEDIGAEINLPKAQDKVLYWAVCCTEGELTYRGVKHRLYNYNYGRGTEGTEGGISLEECKKFFSQALSENKIDEIAKRSPIYDPSLDPILEKSRYNLIRHSVRNLLRLSRNDMVAGFNIITDYWNKETDKTDIVCALAEFSRKRQSEISDVLYSSDFLSSPLKKEIKVVGTFYHRMDNGGIQRVISLLTEIWHGKGYGVVLFTDCEPSPDDYPLPSYVVRVKTSRPISACRTENYAERGKNLAHLLKQYNVDCMVYHSYFSDVLLYDACICKAVSVPFVLYVHNVFSRYLLYGDPKFSTIPKFSRLSDAVVCLDETSAQWWRCFNPNTYKVLNPPTFRPNASEPLSDRSRSILFLCRLEKKHKRPDHAADIAELVVKRFPDAKMYIVGSGDEDYVKTLKKSVSKRGLDNNIFFVGFTKDVEKYYRECGVFLSCSSHEGAPMTLCEALSFGMPVVMYELPYLEIVKGNPGIISVPQNDKISAADAICRLFADDGLLKETGKKGKSFTKKMYSYDIGEKWEQIFDSLKNENIIEHKITDNPMSEAADIIVNDYLAGCGDGKPEQISLRRKIKRYYRQFGLKRTVKRVFEKITEG